MNDEIIFKHRVTVERAAFERAMTALDGSHSFTWTVIPRSLRNPFVEVRCKFTDALGTPQMRGARDVVPAKDTVEEFNSAVRYAELLILHSMVHDARCSVHSERLTVLNTGARLFPHDVEAAYDAEDYAAIDALMSGESSEAIREFMSDTTSPV